RPMLSGLLQELDAAVAADLADYDHLHRVRIIGKRLRYAMEIFAECFDPAFREQLYPAVEQMQEILGNANDSHVACQRGGEVGAGLTAVWREGWKRYRTGIEALLRHHRQRLPRERERFLAWWQRWQKSGGEAAFAGLLKAPEAAAS